MIHSREFIELILSYLWYFGDVNIFGLTWVSEQ